MIPLSKCLTSLPKTIFNISGKDSTKFLNGLLTVRPPTNEYSATPTGSFACMLNSKGRVVADLFVYNIGINEYLVEVDEALEEKILRQLEFYKLTSEVDIRPSNLKSWYLWDDDTELAVNANDMVFQDFRVAELGAKVLAESKPVDQDLVNPQEYTLRRYLFGIAEGHKEFVSGKTLPLEFNIDFLNGADFTKGCYVGQELTIRTKHHGVIRKRVVPVVFTAPGGQIPEQIYAPLEFEAPPGASILDQSPVPHAATSESPFGSVGKSRPAGSIIAGMGNIGLASLRIDKLGHQFGLENGTQVHPMMPFWWPQDVSTN